MGREFRELIDSSRQVPYLALLSIHVKNEKVNFIIFDLLPVVGLSV